MSGDVNINYCNFLYNKQFEGHGTAIHYLSGSMLTSSPLKLIITECNFCYNERAKSIIYFGHLSMYTNFCKLLKLQNSNFFNNIGVSIYLSNQDLHINGRIEFYNNTSENGGGIFISNQSTVIFHKHAAVNFTNNRATNNVGAIFLTNHSSIFFKDHSTSYQCYDNELYDTTDHSLGNLVVFFNNTATGFGQDIYAHTSNITVGDDVKVLFDGNASGWHSPFLSSCAIYIDYYCTVTFEGNCNTTYINYTVNGKGGELSINNYSTIIFKGNCKAIFTNNRAANGGGMFIYFYSAITFEENSEVAFFSNGASSNGGVMYITAYSTIIFKGNSKVTFDDNKASNGNGELVFIPDKSTIIIDLSNPTFPGNSTATSK